MSLLGPSGLCARERRWQIPRRNRDVARRPTEHNSGVPRWTRGRGLELWLDERLFSISNSRKLNVKAGSGCYSSQHSLGQAHSLSTPYCPGSQPLPAYFHRKFVETRAHRGVAEARGWLVRRLNLFPAKAVKLTPRAMLGLKAWLLIRDADVIVGDS